MRVAIYGAGGVGGYLAARLAASGHATTAVIARGHHLEAIRVEGLRLESPRGDVHVYPVASDHPDDIGQVDLVLMATKGTDVPAAARQLGPLLHDRTMVLTLQNGIDSAEHVAESRGAGHVLAGVSYTFSTVAAPGRIRHSAGPVRFVSGAIEPRAQPRMPRSVRCSNRLASIMRSLKIPMWRCGRSSRSPAQPRV